MKLCQVRVKLCQVRVKLCQVLMHCDCPGGHLAYAVKTSIRSDTTGASDTGCRREISILSTKSWKIVLTPPID